VTPVILNTYHLPGWHLFEFNVYECVAVGISYWSLGNTLSFIMT